MVKQKFPEVLFVRRETDDDSTWFNAQRTAAEALEEDGPETIAVYRLHKLQTVRKILNVTDLY